MSRRRRIVLSEDDFIIGTAQSTPMGPGAVAGQTSLPPLEPRPHSAAPFDAPSTGGPLAAGVPVADRPRVGAWGVAIFFFGLIGGAIGYFALKRTDPRRADHVLKWGLIISALSIAAWTLLWVIVLAIVPHNASSGAVGALGLVTGIR